MGFWIWLWTLLWFGGVAVFAVLGVLITIRGGQDLRALLRGLEAELPTGDRDAR